MNLNKHTVLFTTDKLYLPHLSTALYSLLVNNKSFFFDIFIFTSGISKYDENCLNKICNKNNCSLNIKILDEKIFDQLPTNFHFKSSNYYRLFAAELIDCDKCLYLDSDIIITRSIGKLFEIDLQNYYLAAVENPAFTRHIELGMKRDSKYFNSGVMLINLSKWRNTRMKDLVFSRLLEKKYFFEFADQCGLNSIIDGNWLELGLEYNLQTIMLNDFYYKINLKNNEPIIIHYSGSSKPWHIKNKHPYKSNYWFYRNKTPYKSIFPDDLQFKKIYNFFKLYFFKKTGIIKSL